MVGDLKEPRGLQLLYSKVQQHYVGSMPVSCKKHRQLSQSSCFIGSTRIYHFICHLANDLAVTLEEIKPCAMAPPDCISRPWD